MIIYIFKSVICMVLLFGLYWLILRKEKLFMFNRYYLILSVLFSFTVPFLSIPVSFNSGRVSGNIAAVINNIPDIKYVQNEQATYQTTVKSVNLTPIPENQKVFSKPSALNGSTVFLIIYLSGFLLMFFRFSRNLHQVIRLFRISEKIEHESYRIALIEKKFSPFSFMHTIYVNRQDYLMHRISPEIIKHELEHIRQFHSFDIIFFELITVIFWFNPVLPLYNRAAKINHEYLADEAVTKNYPDVRPYASELVSFISCGPPMPVTSGISPSMIRLRLLMLNTQTSRWKRNVRMCISLITSVVVMFVLSIRPAYPETMDDGNKKKSVKKDDIVIDEVLFRGADFRLLKALVVMDGRELGPADTVAVDPKNIKTIEVLKNGKAIRKYGKNAKDGVVVISTYEKDRSSVPDSLTFKPMYTVNNKVPDGKISIPVSNLYSFTLWNYPVFPNQDIRKRWRTIDIMTRDFYRIRGKVIQKNGEPLPGVMVTSTDNPSKVLTDNDGRFELSDVKPDAMATLSAEGYNPFYFKVWGVVFTVDLKVTLSRNDEPEAENNISISYNIRDFSGTWKYNKELSRNPFPMLNSVYDIHQFDSDSILMNITSTYEKDRELINTTRYFFNTVRTKTEEKMNGKSVTSCWIAPDGQSFSVTHYLKSTLGTFRDSKSTQSYSLSGDGRQLFVRRVDYSDVSAETGEEIMVMVFDRI